jgi:hypothetical protein
MNSEEELLGEGLVRSLSKLAMSGMSNRVTRKERKEFTNSNIKKKIDRELASRRLIENEIRESYEAVIDAPEKRRLLLWKSKLKKMVRLLKKDHTESRDNSNAIQQAIDILPRKEGERIPFELLPSLCPLMGLGQIRLDEVIKLFPYSMQMNSEDDAASSLVGLTVFSSHVRPRKRISLKKGYREEAEFKLRVALYENDLDHLCE